MAVEEIKAAYRKAAGRWTGCDWPTEFGSARLNLDGLMAAHAAVIARATAGSERAAWLAAVTWLTEVEQDAKEAEEEATTAVILAASGKLAEALEQAQRACAIESKYHRRLAWQALRDALEAAMAATRELQKELRGQRGIGEFFGGR